MNTQFTISTPPATEPVTLTEAQESLEIASGFADDKLTDMIESARQDVEKYLNRALITQTITLKLDRFPENEVIYLPKTPAQTLTSFNYLDSSGNSQSLSDGTDFDFTSTGDTVRLNPKDVGWPVVDSEQKEVITIVYMAGYGAAADVPGAIKQAILMHIDWQFSKGVISPDLWKTMCNRYIAYFDYEKNE